MKKAFLRALLLLGLMLGAALFLMQGNVEQIVGILRQLEWSDMLLLLILAILVTVLQGVIFWKIICWNGIHFRLKDALQNVFISGFVSGIFSTTFGKGAQFMLLRAKNISWETTCHVGLVDQILYYIADIFICSFCIFSYRNYFQSAFPELWWVSITGLMITFGIFLCLLLLYIPIINTAVSSLLERLSCRLKPQGKLQAVNRIFQGFVLEVRTAAMRKQHNKRRYISVISLNIMKVLVRNSLMFAAVYLLNQQVNFYDFPIYFASACFLEMALSALPVYGDKGTAEIGFVLVFGSLVGQVPATSAMLVWRFFSFYMTSFAGAIVLGMSPQIHLKEILQSGNEQKE